MGTDLFWIQRSVLLANVLALVSGLVLVVVAAILADEAVVAAVLSLVGGSFVSVAVVAMVLGSITARETIAQVDSALLRGLQDVLEPVRDPVFAGALQAYRWDCYLAAAADHDPHPDHAYQCIRLSYRVDDLPSELRMMCAATRDDRALEAFTAEEYLFRWLVDDDLDVTDQTVFRIGSLEVDNEALACPPPRVTDVVGGQAAVVSCSVPKRLRETTGHLVSLNVVVRKFVASERRIRVQTQLFRTVTDAEFRLVVDPVLEVGRIWPTTSEVSSIGVARGGTAETTFAPPFENTAAIIRLPFPLQPGSTIAFQIDRTGSGPP